MKSGIFFALLSAISFGVYNFLSKLTSEKFNAVFAIVIISGASFAVSLFIAFVMKMNGQTFEYSKTTLWLPALTGVTVVLAEIAYLIAFQKGLALSIGNPLVIGGTTLVAVLLGVFALGEQLTAIKFFAIGLIFAGLALIAK